MDPTALLDMMMSGRGKMRPAQLLQQLASDSTTDPAMARLVSTVLSRVDASDEDDDEEGDEDALKAAQNEVKRLRSTLEDVQRELKALSRTATRLARRNDLLAESLGACPECWGEDLRCSVCEGRGTAGSAMPSRETFLIYVAPAARRMRPQAPPRSSFSNHVNEEERSHGTK